QGSMIYAVVIGLAGGLAGKVAANITRKSLSSSLSRLSFLISGTLTGIVLGGVAMFAMLSVVRYAIYLIFGTPPPGENAWGLLFSVTMLLVLHLVFGLIVAWRQALQVLLINVLVFLALVIMFVVMYSFQFFSGTSIALPVL